MIKLLKIREYSSTAEDPKSATPIRWNQRRAMVMFQTLSSLTGLLLLLLLRRSTAVQGPYAPQGSTSLLPKLSVTSKVSARTSCAWVGRRARFWSSEDVILLEFTLPVERE